MAYQPIRSGADVATRLVPGVTRENHALEYKGLNTRGWPYANDDKGKDECRRDVAQFANAEGGTLIIGAVEHDHTLSCFITVPHPNEVVRWVDELVKEKLEPAPAIEPYILREPSGGHIVAINIPPALRLIGLRVKQGYEFVVRTADAKRYLRLSEIEARMQDKDRIHRLRLSQIGADSMVGLDAQVDRDLGHNDWRVARVEDDYVILKKNDGEVTVPLTYVEAVYSAGLPDAEWIIALSCWLSRHRQRQVVTTTKNMPFGRNEGHYRSRGMD